MRIVEGKAALAECLGSENKFYFADKSIHSESEHHANSLPVHPIKPIKNMTTNVKQYNTKTDVISVEMNIYMKADWLKRSQLRDFFLR